MRHLLALLLAAGLLTGGGTSAVFAEENATPSPPPTEETKPEAAISCADHLRAVKVMLKSRDLMLSAEGVSDVVNLITRYTERTDCDDNAKTYRASLYGVDMENAPDLKDYCEEISTVAEMTERYFTANDMQHLQEPYKTFYRAHLLAGGCEIPKDEEE